MLSTGSGTVVVDGQHVLTNAHVVLTASGGVCSDYYVGFTERFEDPPSRWVPAELVAYEAGPRDSEGNVSLPDLAVLRLSRRSGRTAVPVGVQRLEPGDEIVTLGFPGTGGETMTLTRGAYSGMLESGDHDYIKTDADISPGNSGGAAFDGQGNFVGVPTAGSPPERGFTEVGLLIPAAEATRFLARHVGD